MDNRAAEDYRIAQVQRMEKMVEEAEAKLEEAEAKVVTAEIKGKAEGEEKKALEIAKNLLLQNIDINTISAATGLSISEINKLKS